jgi:hypothetical protein
MLLNNVEVRRYEAVSVPYTSGSTQSQINFPDQPNLRGAKVHGIDLPGGLYDYYGRTNFNYASGVVTNIFCTLYSDGREIVQNMPLAELGTIRAAGATYVQNPFNTNGILAFNGQVITWTKSYLSFSTGFTPIVGDGVFILGIYYSL